MPLYEYLCRDCGHAFETLVARWGTGVRCPACHSEAAEKQLSRFAVAGHDPGPPCRSAEGGGGCPPGGCGYRT